MPTVRSGPSPTTTSRGDIDTVIARHARGPRRDGGRPFRRRRRAGRRRPPDRHAGVTLAGRARHRPGATRPDLVTETPGIACRARTGAPTPARSTTRFYDLVEARFRRLMRDNPVAGHVLRHPRLRRPARRRRPRGAARRARRGPRHLARDRGARPGGAVPARPLRARPRDPQPPRGRSSRPTSCGSGSAGHWRSTPSATACSCCSPAITRRSPSVSTRSPAGSRRCRRYLEEARTRSTEPQVRLWQRIEIESAGGAADPVRRDRRRRAGRPRAGGAAAAGAGRSRPAAVEVDLCTTWLEGTLADGDRRLAASAASVHDADGRAPRVRRPRCRRDPGARLARSWPRSMRRGPPRPARSTRTPTRPRSSAGSRPTTRRRSRRRSRRTGWRCVGRAPPDRARPRQRPRRRAHRRHRDARVPAQRRPVRGLLLAGAFDRDSKGIYVVTPSVDDDPNAMREHNRASISNTSIHEAYPGHHLQLDVARRHPSLTRLLADAPEFVEGWGMYSELMMREQGFDDAPDFRVVLHTDAIWRACRIILDVRLHRGELDGRRGDRLPGRADRASSGPTPAPRSTGTRTARPTRCRTCSAGRCSSSCGPTSSGGSATRSRSGPSTTRCCATGRCRSASIAACSPARAPDRVLVIPSIDLEGGRSRVVYWPGASAGIGAPTDRPDRIVERLVDAGRALIHLVDFDGARTGGPPTSRRSARSRRASAVPLQLAGGLEAAEAIQLAFAAGATRVVLTTAIADRPDDLRACLAVAGDWLAVGLDPRPERLAAFPWRRPAPPTVDALVEELVGAGVARFVLAHGGIDPGPRAGAFGSFGRTMPRSSSPAGSATSTASAACAIPAPPASSSVRRSSPGPSTFPQPWRPPHDPALHPLVLAGRRRRPALRRVHGWRAPAAPIGGDARRPRRTVRRPPKAATARRPAGAAGRRRDADGDDRDRPGRRS